MYQDHQEKDATAEIAAASAAAIVDKAADTIAGKVAATADKAAADTTAAAPAVIADRAADTIADRVEIADLQVKAAPAAVIETEDRHTTRVQVNLHRKGAVINDIP